VNADIGSIDVEFVDKPDFKFNSAGVKGLGEVAISGVAPAIANAVYHTTTCESATVRHALAKRSGRFHEAKRIGTNVVLRSKSDPKSNIRQ
jgi:hypothetical protein